MVYSQPQIHPGKQYPLTVLIKKNQLICTRWPKLVIINKKKKENLPYSDYRVKLKEGKKREKYQDLTRELKNKPTMEHESDGDTNSNWYAKYSHQRTGSGTGGIWNKSTRGNNYRIGEIGQNTD